MSPTRTARTVALAVPLVLAVSGTLTSAAGAATPELSRRIAAVAEARAPQADRQATTAAQTAASTTLTLPLASGGAVTSPDGQTRVVMQEDGNLVVYRAGKAVYNTRTFIPGSTLTAGEDGNLQVTPPPAANEGPGDPPVENWVWSTTILGGARSVVDDTGALQVLNAGGSVLWSSARPSDDDVYAAEEPPSLAPGESYSTIQGGRLVMQTDGNLVSYARDGAVLFNTGTFVPGSRFAAQDDGNGVIYGPDGRWLWQTGTTAGAPEILLYDGELFVLAAEEVVFYSGEDAGIRNPVMVASMTGGQSVTSLNGRYRLDMQTDGNLVLYDTRTRRALWNTRTSGNAGASFHVQTDGNLVVRTTTKVLWNSRTAGHTNTRLVLQDDGNLVLYSATNRPLWFTKR